MSDSTNVPTVRANSGAPQMSHISPKCPTIQEAPLPVTRAKRDPSSPLTPLQHQAITLLCSGVDCSTAATRLNVDRRTLHRWRTQNPFFRAELNRRQFDLHDTASRQLRLLLLRSLKLVADELHDDACPPERRIRAAQALLRRIDLSELLAAPTHLNDTACVDQLILDARHTANQDPTTDVSPDDRNAYLKHLLRLEHQDPPMPMPPDALPPPVSNLKSEIS